ncbi:MULTISPECIES: glycosyltransferase family 2 protein [Pacificibacter]|uniref:glycosyltransferase family 2 protein n=1 Tax=Pacificibacter TaxID=1042323 RepID=UPI001C0877BB|nr:MULTISPECIES: glycosyltransferase family 2 protein [Pacificibacter]MBU2935342.1 glycosyltransferase [Pacificibacter marinus]MDO6615497.1 glycosyltransferase [Pacificibacter sp. 1_MG-2023]
MLVDIGALTPQDLVRATAMRQRHDARIGDILLAHGMVNETTLYAVLAKQYGAEVANFDAYAADVRLIDTFGADACLRQGVLPWRRVGSTVLIASCRPEQFEDMRPRLTALFGPVRMAVASETTMHDALMQSRQRKLAKAAETRVAAHESCRELDIARLTRVLSAIGFVIIATTIAFPHAMFFALVCWAILVLVVTSVLKLAAAVAQARLSQKRQSTFSTIRRVQKLPTVSVMVPLFHEREIAGRLVKRLSKLTYPRELLDICLVVEEDDTITQDAVARTDLPRWMRMIVVPRGGVKTKPRALNFALDFCRGTIIGIYDAEDAPERDQIHKVAHHFAQAPPDVACVQGILDFYNARTNWLARCFTVEYASWFRIILPGYERLGLVVPLGGTTLFFRREAIEKLGGWDAHNVTEDADLGIRLARHGYRTELIRTVTDEEANCRLWPWVKQRSRWLKGYAMTWAMHMRNPRKLLADLGWWKFFGVQVLFFGALSNFLLAPLLWSFWSMPLGLHHPLQDVVPNGIFLALGALFLMSEVITVAIGMLATSTPKHKGLWKWVPTLHFYYPLGTLAAIKGLWEVVTRPYYWDKTAHGLHDLIADPDNENSITPQAEQKPKRRAQDVDRKAGDQLSVEAFAETQSVQTPSDATVLHYNAPLVLKACNRVAIGDVPYKLTQANRVDPPSFKHASGFREPRADFDTLPTARPRQRRLTFGLNLAYDAKDIVPVSMSAQNDAGFTGAHSDLSPVCPAPKRHASDTSAHENQFATGQHIMPKLLQNVPHPVADNTHMAPDMAHAAAFLDIPE